MVFYNIPSPKRIVDYGKASKLSICGRISKCRTLKKHTLAEVENPAEGRTPDVGFIRNLAFIVLHYF
ncbi:MAG: hypothetical protein ACI9LA_002131, partial [Bacteroidia bacterium]